MSKIKKIEISDFRIYEGKEEFNFEGDNGVSNLVALYAPNGFGKTSFFDAIEWSFSNEIKRFENNFIKKAIKDEQEDTILLTNTTSYNKGLKGRVRILTDKDSFLEKTVQRYKKSGTEFYNDYRKGVLSKGAIAKDLSEIPETNILTQDQIDTFLRFKTPEEKFAALKDFWPQSEDATNRLKQLSELHNSVTNNLDSTNAQIINLNKELKSLTEDNKNITQINIWLQKLKEQKIFKCNITVEKIDDTISQENYEIIYDDNSRNIKVLNLEIEKVEIIKSELYILQDKIDNYISDNDKVKIAEEKHVKLQKRQSNFLNLKKSKEIEKSKSIEIENLNSRIENYKYVDSHVLNYLSDLKKIEDFKVEEKSLLNENTRLLDHIQIQKQSISNFKQHEKQCNSNRLDKEKQHSTIDKQYNEFVLINKQLAERKKDLPELNLKIDSKNIQINDLQKRNQIFGGIIEKEDYTNSILIDNEKFKELCFNLKINTESVDQIKSDISSKQKKLDKSGTLNENLNKIILFGEDYINKTNTSDCPLCKTPFNTFENLIKNIKLEKNDTLKLAEQKDEISSLSNKLSELLETRTELIESINKVISSEKEEIYKELLKAKDNKNELDNKFNDINNKIRNLEYDLKIINDLFSNLIKNTVVIDESKIEFFKKDLHKEILAQEIKENRLKGIIKIKEDILLEKENKLSTDQSILDKNKTSVKLIQTQEYYQKTINILIEYKIIDSQLQKPLIEEIIIADVEKLLNKERGLKTVSIELKSLEGLILNDKIQIDEANLDGNIFETESLIKSIKKSIEDYKTKFNKYIPGEEITEEEIINQQLKKLKIFDDLLIIKEDLNSFGIDLELIKENIKKNKFEKKLQNLNKKLPRLITTCKKIKAAKVACMSFVETGINNYFNKDVINEVYSRIEPHPKLTKIDFTTDFNDKGEPRLLIRTGNRDEKVNPVLFLSAGQVNVLSLSIFLAKAFEYGNETINTIFMDDPIQNLSDINVLSFIDLLRTLISTHDKQIVMSTHDEKFFRLLQNKLPEEYCNTKYLEFESEGKLKQTNKQMDA